MPSRTPSSTDEIYDAIGISKDDDSTDEKGESPDAEISVYDQATDHATETTIGDGKDSPHAEPPVRVFSAESIIERIKVVDERTLPVRILAAISSAADWLFGLLSMICGLALLAPLPLLQFISLGYLLEASGRVARSGRMREGFIGIRAAARVGSFVAGAWLMILPLRIISDFWHNAHLIAPGSDVARGWRMALIVLTAIMVAHIVSAWYCGGRFRHFFWPILAPFSLTLWLFRSAFKSVATQPLPQSGRRPFHQRLLADIAGVRPLNQWFLPAMLWHDLRRGRIVSRSRDAVWDFVRGMRLPHFFWLGVRGFCGAVAWLFVPAMLLIVAISLGPPVGVLAGLFGAVLLASVLLYLPFLQCHFAAENRFVAMFEIGEVRRLFRRAPIAFWMALLVALLFALPLYLLTIEYTPREVAFLPGIVFVTFIYPARLLAGWAIGRARRRERPRHFIFRWLSRLLAIPVVLYYVLVVYLMQYLHWHGELSLFEQHAFLVPAPFLGL